MTTKHVPYPTLLTLLALLIIEFPEPAEDEGVEDVQVENIKGESHDKPPMQVALNGNYGDDEDE
jgi:hypothetical protein